MKPDWKAFCNTTIATIRQYREWNAKLQELSSVNRDVYSQHFEATLETEKLHSILATSRNVISTLYPENPSVQRLNGYILFASESNKQYEHFIKNILIECKDLENYE